MTDYSGLVEMLRERTFAKTPGMQRTCEEAAAAIEAQRRELDEARAELAKETRWVESLNRQCSALRAAIEAHNAKCDECEYLGARPRIKTLKIPLPPAALEAKP
jgi:DNA-binding transcriptional MerR regulator